MKLMQYGVAGAARGAVLGSLIGGVLVVGSSNAPITKKLLTTGAIAIAAVVADATFEQEVARRLEHNSAQTYSRCAMRYKKRVDDYIEKQQMPPV